MRLCRRRRCEKMAGRRGQRRRRAGGHGAGEASAKWRRSGTGQFVGAAVALGVSISAHSHITCKII